MASQPGTFNLQELADAGAPLVGGRLYTYAYGTTTQKTAYTDAAATVPHTYTADGTGGQYIALNARGELPAPLYLASGSYDLALKRADGSTVWTRAAEGQASSSDITALSAGFAASGGAALVGFLQAGTGAVARDAQSKMRDTLSVFDYMTAAQIADVQAGTLLLDVAAAIQSALDHSASIGGGRIFIPAGTYKCNSALVVNGTAANQNSANLLLEGAGGYGTVLDFTGAGASTDGIQINGAGRWRIQGITVKNAKRYGININSGMSPGGVTFVSRFSLKDVIVDGAATVGIRQANSYMGLMEDIECRNGGGNGFSFEGDHTTITCIRCWAGGDAVSPNGGNAGTGWYINGIVYSSFIGCAADNNGAQGWQISNAGTVNFTNCGAEANKQEGFLAVASSANTTGATITGIKGVTFDGCFGYNNSLLAADSFANFLGISTANGVAAKVALKNCSDILAGSQTTSFVANGTSGQINLYESDNALQGNRVITGTVVYGDYLSASSTSGTAAALVSAVTANAGSPATSLTLPAGDWEVWGIADFNAAATTVVSNVTAGISTVSATFGAQDTFFANRIASVTPNGVINVLTPKVIVRSPSGGTVVYMPVLAVFSTSTLSAYGSLFARRVG